MGAHFSWRSWGKRVLVLLMVVFRGLHPSLRRRVRGWAWTERQICATGTFSASDPVQRGLKSAISLVPMFEVVKAECCAGHF